MIIEINREKFDNALTKIQEHITKAQEYFNSSREFSVGNNFMLAISLGQAHGVAKTFFDLGIFTQNQYFYISNCITDKKNIDFEKVTFVITRIELDKNLNKRV